MKTLWLCRHAKTAKASLNISDHQRPLLPQGEACAINLGQRLAQVPKRPELILCSSALRTLSTARLIMTALADPPPLLSLDELYTASPQGVLSLLAGRPENHIMLIGHNPTISELLEQFSENPWIMSPGCCAGLDFSVSLWEELFAPVRAIACQEL
jgi:phosphohistidine phosphatase